MSKARAFGKYWVPVLIWMALIFTASQDNESYQHSSRIIAPLLHWLFPSMPNARVDLLVFIARKCAHLTEYAILGLLVWRAVRKPSKSKRRPWSWNEAGFAVLFVALYAASDEIHQLFIPTRYATVHDVIIDTTGAMLGLFLLWGFGHWRKWWVKTAPTGHSSQTVAR